jgi:hypothetical protein
MHEKEHHQQCLNERNRKGHDGVQFSAQVNIGDAGSAQRKQQ